MESVSQALESSEGALFDERGRPDFRDLFGALATKSDRISTAVTRVRLSTLDLTPGETARLTRFRVLVAELNALTLDAEARLIQSDHRRAPFIERLRRMLEDGRLEVRAAPLAGWSPDFSVFSVGGRPHRVLTGFHWFERPFPHRGPALASLHGGDAALLAARRHSELWSNAHDVGPAVWSILSKAKRSAGLLGVATG